MSQEKDCAYDSDQSDEDFCPDKVDSAAESDAVSEEETDDDIDSVEEAPEEPKKHVKTKKNGLPTKGTQRKRTRPAKKEVTSDGSDTSDEDEDRAVDSKICRSTRQCAASTEKTSAHEKDVLASDEEDKTRADALWADFLGTSTTPARAETSTAKTNGNSHAVVHSKAEEKNEPSKKITITEVVDFAGEEVRVQKTVAADSIKENKACTQKSPAARGLLAAGFKRTGGGFGSASSSAGGSQGGVGSILNQLGKKKKLSVLEKTKLDWNSFKQDEGIDEQLQTFNKGKDGFLERQDFLQRTDLRQFEIEKNLRQSRRNH